jgi:hypothetical protein
MTLLKKFDMNANDLILKLIKMCVTSVTTIDMWKKKKKKRQVTTSESFLKKCQLIKLNQWKRCLGQDAGHKFDRFSGFNKRKNLDRKNLKIMQIDDFK